jgi:hypothetical protein
MGSKEFEEIQKKGRRKNNLYTRKKYDKTGKKGAF